MPRVSVGHIKSNSATATSACLSSLRHMKLRTRKGALSFVHVTRLAGPGACESTPAAWAEDGGAPCDHRFGQGAAAADARLRTDLDSDLEHGGGERTDRVCSTVGSPSKRPYRRASIQPAHLAWETALAVDVIRVAQRGEEPVPAFPRRRREYSNYLAVRVRRRRPAQLDVRVTPMLIQTTTATRERLPSRLGLAPSVQAVDLGLCLPTRRCRT